MMARKVAIKWMPIPQSLGNYEAIALFRSSSHQKHECFPHLGCPCLQRAYSWIHRSSVHTKSKISIRIMKRRGDKAVNYKNQPQANEECFPRTNR